MPDRLVGVLAVLSRYGRRKVAAMSLSDRERQVVVLVGLLGRTYMQVAIELGISPRTVEHHAERVAARSEFGYLPPRKALARVYLVELASPDLLLP